MRLAEHLTRLPGEVVLLMALVSGLSGCDETKSIVQPAPKAAPAALEKRFGAGFVAMSRADPNSKPRQVAPGDLPPVSLTERPVEF